MTRHSTRRGIRTLNRFTDVPLRDFGDPLVCVAPSPGDSLFPAAVLDSSPFVQRSDKLLDPLLSSTEQARWAFPGTPATPDDPLFRRSLLRVAEVAVKISEGVPVDLAAAQ
jgi:hypothetical protein